MTEYLHAIHEPADLRSLGSGSLADVARELRDELIAIGAEAGGHFAGSLGALELVLGIHYVFDTPTDRVVWDVGHQAYAHKAVTGRLKGLWRVKKVDGPSGFLRRSESAFDVFGAGHAGTSVSAALGIAEAQRRAGSKARSLAVIGDGAATAGMSFEAFNHAGDLTNDVKVVFNDNGMSIAPSVGGLHRTGRARDYFKALGLTYLGAVDGHDFDALLPGLVELRDAVGPTVLHVKTRKGQGFVPAEHDPYRWHATGPFEKATGKRATSRARPSWTASFADALLRIASRDERVVALTAAMPDGTGLDRFEKRYPERFYDVGIAEQHGVTFAAGMATEGLRPVCAIYSTFLQRGFDQIVHDVALQNLPVTFVLDRAGFVGADGPTHHGALDLAYLRGIPNMTIAAPRDENELQNLLAAAVDSDGPWAIRIPRGEAPGIACNPTPKPTPVGLGVTLQSGNDVALVGLGKAVPVLQEAAARLRKQEINAEVIDARFAKPLDVLRIAEAARRCGRVVTVEDHVAKGGFGSAVLEMLAREAPDAGVRILGHADHFVEHGDVGEQWRSAGIDAVSVADATARWIEEDK